MKGSIYHYPRVYAFAMRLAYGKEYGERYQMIADQFSGAADVLEVCCGDLRLYDELHHRGLLRAYLGLELAPAMVRRACERGVSVQTFDVRTAATMPPADVVIMQASLCQFHQETDTVLRCMWQAARVRMILAEPVVNMSQSAHGLVRRMALLLSRTTDGRDIPFRYDESSLRATYERVGIPIHTVARTSRGREIVIVSDKAR